MSSIAAAATADEGAAPALSPSAARAALIRLCAAGFVAYCSYSICRAPLLPLFARELGAGPSLVGFVMGALVFATLPFTYLVVSTMAWLVVLRFLHGSATGIFGPVASASLSDIAPAARRGTWLSTYSTAQGTGQALGPVLAGYLNVTASFMAGIPARRHGRGWRPTRAHYQRRPCRSIRAQRHAQCLPATLRSRRLESVCCSDLGWLFGLQTVTTLMVRPAIGLLSDRVGRRSVIVIGLAVCSTAVFSLSLATTLSTVSAVVLTYAAGVAISTAATSAYITDITKRARYGAAHGVFGTIYDIGDAFGPIAAGLLVASLGYARMFQIMAAVALVMALLFANTSRATSAERSRSRDAHY